MVDYRESLEFWSNCNILEVIERFENMGRKEKQQVLKNWYDLEDQIRIVLRNLN